MLARYKKMLENNSVNANNDSDFDKEKSHKKHKGFFGFIKFFFANILTLGLYGRMKKRNKNKILNQIENETKIAGDVSKVSETELKKEIDEAESVIEKELAVEKSENNKSEQSNGDENEKNVSQLGE